MGAVADVEPQPLGEREVTKCGVSHEQVRPPGRQQLAGEREEARHTVAQLTLHRARIGMLGRLGYLRSTPPRRNPSHIDIQEMPHPLPQRPRSAPHRRLGAPLLEHATAPVHGDREVMDDLRRGPLAGRGGVPVGLGPARQGAVHHLGEGGEPVGGSGRALVRRACSGPLAVVALGVAAVLLPRPVVQLAPADSTLTVIDYHAHTAASHDGRPGWTARDLARWHAAQGFEASYVTDHNAIFDDDTTGYPIPLLPGVEWSVYGQHVVALGPVTTIALAQADWQPWTAAYTQPWLMLRGLSWSERSSWLTWLLVILIYRAVPRRQGDPGGIGILARSLSLKILKLHRSPPG